MSIGAYFVEYFQHFFCEFVTVSGRVEAQEGSKDSEHDLGLLARHAEAGDFGEMFHAVHFALQISLAQQSEPIGLFTAGIVFFLEAFNPAFFE